MRGYYWGAGVVRCSFCHATGHNITTCKMVDSTASVALDKMDKNPSYVVTHLEHSALYEIKNRIERKQKKRPANRKKPRCSYCKSLNHKRPKCSELNDFKMTVHNANLNWKREFVHVVNESGMGIGSLIGSYDGNIGLVTNYNLDLLNVFCALESYSQYQNRANFEILVNNEVEEVSYDSISRIVGGDLFSQSWWQSEHVVVSPVPWEPPSDWINNPDSDSFDWFFKRINKSDLNNTGITRFIEKWANKN